MQLIMKLGGKLDSYNSVDQRVNQFVRGGLCVSVPCQAKFVIGAGEGWLQCLSVYARRSGGRGSAV